MPLYEKDDSREKLDDCLYASSDLLVRRPKSVKRWQEITLLNRIYAGFLFVFCLTEGIATNVPSVLAQEVKSSVTPLLIAQIKYTRTVRAVSGPDAQGRWRFNSPTNVAPGGMESQGCTLVTISEPSWRCPDRMIEVPVHRGYTLTVRAVSGPDAQGRWRFNSPTNVAPNGMESQGCTLVTISEPSWRCPDRMIEIPVDR